MGKFTFGPDWQGKSLTEAVEELQEGRLPGKLGLAQQIIGHWVIRKEDRGWLAYGKASLDTLGSLLSYRERQKKVIDGGKDASVVWLTDNGFIEAFPNHGYSFISFVSGALNSVEYAKLTIRDKYGKPAASTLLVFDIGPGKKAYFLDPQGNTPKKTKTSTDSNHWSWDGPFVKAEDYDDLVEFVRQTVWDQMGSDTLLLSHESSFSGDKVQISSMHDKFDFCSARDSYNDVKQLATRCKAFLDTGRNRNLLFYGPPGTGKSTLARAIAEQLKMRVVLIEHDAVSHMTGSAHQIIGLLQPGMLILNDIDRGRISHNISLLQALERSHQDHALLSCLTVNDIEKLDPAILRPGRVHETREIPEPSDESRRMILDYYVEKFGIKITTEESGIFMEQTSEFSPADTREFCETALAVGVKIALEEIPRIIEQRKLYAGDACKRFNNRNRLAEPE